MSLRKKLVLISPHPADAVGEENVSVLSQMPLALAYLKALTPGGWDVDVIDETRQAALDRYGELTFDGADLVGMSVMTHQAPRAYAIARACRARGIPVVAGGIHPTSFPDEVARHVDCVCLREGFRVWTRVMEDFESRRLAARYDGGLNDLSILGGIEPDREFLRQKYGYRYTSIVGSAGCPYQCDFCFVPLFQGRKYRERPVEDVLGELKGLRGRYRGMIWTDENFYGHGKLSHARTLKLFRAMAELDLGFNWFGFTSIHISEDHEVLKAMAEAGAVGVLIGFESVEPETLKLIGKRFNMRAGRDGYRRAVDAIRSHGLAVWATMMFGTDNDTPETFDRVADFVLESEVDVMTCGIYGPSPGSRMYRKLTEEGRFFRQGSTEDWRYATAMHLLHVMKRLRLRELIEGLERIYRRLFTTEVLRERFKRSSKALGNPNAALFAFRVNLDWQHVFRHLIGNLERLEESGLYAQALRRLGWQEMAQ